MEARITRATNQVKKIITQAIQKEVFPGATLWIRWHGETIHCAAYGNTADKKHDTYSPAPVTLRTLYDVASLTKVLATTWAFMNLKERGLLKLTDRVATYIPQFASDQQKSSITLQHLLTHTSGLPGPLPLYKQYQGKEDILQAIYRQHLLFPPGTQHLYCDVGFILLGEVIRCVGSSELDVYCYQHLFTPLDMNDTMFNPPKYLWERVAPTEYKEQRKMLVHGQVHDENAWVMGGVAGHAGLFSTIEDMAKFCTMALASGNYKGKKVLTSNSIIEMASPHHLQTNEAVGLGWMIDRPSFMGRLASQETFGHTGFTGTSIMMNCQKDWAVVLLSNRVCPTRNGPDINPYRQQVANALLPLF
jgi:serine-type D-Ala-D-Ala carboxypeptidase